MRVGHRLRALGVEVEQPQLGRLLGLGEVAHDGGGDDAPGAEDPDPHGTSSRARSASQNSIRSRALLRSRPVSSSTRRIR